MVCKTATSEIGLLPVFAVGLLIVVLGGCTNEESVPDPAGVGSGGASTTHVIESASLEPAEGAPPWCSALLEENVTSLRSAIIVMADPDRADEVKAIFDGAATELEDALAEVPPTVGASSQDLASALRQIRPGSLTEKPVAELVASLDSFGAEVEPCEFS